MAEHSPLLQPTIEVCPGCGKFVDKLVDATGWCITCTLPIILKEKGGDPSHKLCSECGEPIGDSSHKKCRKCRDADWLLRHADDIDRCLANGLSVYKARQLITAHKNDGIKCLSCGGPMGKATRGIAYFCKKPQCRSAQNKLKRLIYQKGFERSEALKTVLDELKS